MKFYCALDADTLKTLHTSNYLKIQTFFHAFHNALFFFGWEEICRNMLHHTLILPSRLQHIFLTLTGVDPGIFNRWGINTFWEEKWRCLGAHTQSGALYKNNGARPCFCKLGGGAHRGCPPLNLPLPHTHIWKWNSVSGIPWQSTVSKPSSSESSSIGHNS